MAASVQVLVILQCVLHFDDEPGEQQTSHRQVTNACQKFLGKFVRVSAAV